MKMTTDKILNYLFSNYNFLFFVASCLQFGYRHLFSLLSFINFAIWLWKCGGRSSGVNGVITLNSGGPIVHERAAQTELRLLIGQDTSLKITPTSHGFFAHYVLYSGGISPMNTNISRDT